MEQTCLSKDVLEQIKDFRHLKYYKLTKEQQSLIDKLIIDEDLKKRYRKYGLCHECWQLKTAPSWCRSCNSKHFQDNFKNWTSGNHNVDIIIQESQLEAKSPSQVLEWIEYDLFYDVEFLAKGGFGSVSKGKWKNGNIASWDLERNNWKRYKDNMKKDKKIVLKFLYNSQEISLEFLHEVKSHLKMNDSTSFVTLYGISKDPETNCFGIIMDYESSGSLRQYLNKNNNSMYMGERIDILYQIALGLEEMNKKGMIHRDFHSGNIVKGEFMLEHNPVSITDLGLSIPANLGSKDKDQVFGVLPYVAPEVLKNRGYTKESDIYSFGIICYEVLTGLPPYCDRAHDHLLALQICQNRLRPQFKIKVPQLLLELINQCWHEDPSKRPTAERLIKTFSEWKNVINYPIYDSEFYKQYDEADEYNKTLPKDSPYKTHSQAVYSSRSFNFKLPIDADSKAKDSEKICTDFLEFSVSEVEFDPEDI